MKCVSRRLQGGTVRGGLIKGLFDAYLPLIRYEQQPEPRLAVRKYVMMRRGIIASDTMRAQVLPRCDKSKGSLGW